MMNALVPETQHAMQIALDGRERLPAWAYTASAFLALEQRALFAQTWVCIGLERDVASPGDVVPIDCAGRALLMMRDCSGELGVFHNFCRHRGHKLLESPRTGCRRIVCPYHAWVYATDGRLEAAPHFDGPDASDAAAQPIDGLARVRFATWSGLVFVNLSGHALAFEQFIAPLRARWQRYDLSRLCHAESRRFALNGNWKLAVENFIDFYHLPAVHQGLNRYSAMSDHYFVRDGDALFGQGNAKFEPIDGVANAFAPFPGLSDDEKRITEALCLFPNLLITIFSDNMRIILVEPDGPARCRERVEVFVVDESALTEARAADRQSLVARFEAFNNEDIAIVEGLQRAMHETAFDDGCFSPYYDQNVAHFHRQVIAAARSAPELRSDM